MHRQFAALLALGLAFALLWVPFGQHKFLFEHWMKIGAFMAPFLVFVALAIHNNRSTPVYHDLQILSVLMLASYILHQVEEHWIDLTGTHYAFYGYVNALLRDALGAPENTEFLDPAGIFVINTSLVWLVGSFAILFSPKRIFPFLCMAAITLINAVSHIAAALMTASYNPGLATSVLIFVPIALLGFYSAKNAGVSTIVASLLWAILAHVVMVGGIIAVKSAQIISEETYFAMLIGISIIVTLPSGNNSSDSSS
ncbi:MAG: HXXEE domain-containing protein [Pseudomonadota bacterium]